MLIRMLLLNYTRSHPIHKIVPFTVSVIIKLFIILIYYTPIELLNTLFTS